MGCGGCSSDANPRSVACPGCGLPGEAVGHATLRHQLHRPWLAAPLEGDYHFCPTASCDVVYFNTLGTRYTITDLRQAPGQKSGTADRVLCYCFDIRYSDLGDDGTATRCRDFVISQTRDRVCACEERNPSGRCCLRDFPREEE